ncbi:MAG: Flp pilus assembly complex ATPase component TadA [Lentisphaerae bacterium]|jgi:pilus assembly protein CpaF|nr:ATPase, T2SS/T4P/T4SS family [Kiritimatiellia bacterium]NLC81264.1 Flp pilus assembly complex ATPase component TadA [Lentisphaerota bacterium]
MNFFLDIAYPDQASNRFELPAGLYTIGRGEACKIRLRHPEISERHALLTLRETGITIEDLHSSNGTVVDGSPIQEPTRLHADDVVGLGPCLLRVSTAVPIPPETPAAPTPPPLPGAPRAPLPAPAAEPRPPEPSPAPAPEPTDPMAAILREIKNQIHGELIQRLDLKRMTVSRIGTNELQQKARETIRSIIAEVRRNQKLPAGIDPARLEKEIYDEAMRLGPLEDFLADEAITEIMVNGPTQVFVERNGRIELTGQTFMDDESVLGVIERIVAPIGRRIDESQPYVDARLPDGSRVNAIIAPLSLIGPCITIRKFSKRALTVDDFIAFGTWTRSAAEFLRLCVLMRKNIVVAGGTGSGKTTLLNVLSNFIPPTDRIVTIEDAAELRLAQPHVIRLEARPPNIEGRGAITIRDLVRNALRMRPDRIIVGECRSGESLDMLQAMNTGHDGSLTTVHANSPRDVISRLETMVLMSGLELPSRAIREQIASAIDLVVHESRLSDGSRKVTCISEVVGLEGLQIVMQDLFEFKQTGVDEKGKVLGSFMPTGAVPTFFEHLKSRGLHLDPAIFDPSKQGGDA